MARLGLSLPYGVMESWCWAKATIMKTIKMKNDGPARRRLFVEEAFAHPAKGHIGLWQEIIERYTKPGDEVLDPMAGIGTTMLAALQGRNVTCVEMEDHFIKPMVASWEKMRTQPMLGQELGDVRIIQGDARDLSGLADVILTSPPYAQNLAGKPHPTDGGPNSQAKGLGYTDAIVTSPPWQDIDAQVSADKFRDPAAFAKESAKRYRDGSRKGHTASAEAILRHMNKNTKGYTRADAIITSPPYEEAPTRDQSPIQDGSISDVMTRSYRSGIHSNGDNIGNLRKDKYWDAMRQVYSQCLEVLRPASVMVLVVKGFTREGAYVDLPTQTVEMCQDLGFTLTDRWAREVWTLSFWRVLQYNKDPEAFDQRLRFEEVLVFKK